MYQCRIWLSTECVVPVVERERGGKKDNRLAYIKGVWVLTAQQHIVLYLSWRVDCGLLFYAVDSANQTPGDLRDSLLPRYSRLSAANKTFSFSILSICCCCIYRLYRLLILWWIAPKSDVSVTCAALIYIPSPILFLILFYFLLFSI